MIIFMTNAILLAAQKRIFITILCKTQLNSLVIFTTSKFTIIYLNSTLFTSITSYINLGYLIITMLYVFIQFDYLSMQQRSFHPLSCYLCKLDYNNPHMCSNCSQVFCLNCIEKYKNQHFRCPCCNKYILQLINCKRLVDQAKSVVQSICQITNCPRHFLPVKYFCKQCEMLICSDCGVIEVKVQQIIFIGTLSLNQHKNHEILSQNKFRQYLNSRSYSSREAIKNKIQYIQLNSNHYLEQIHTFKLQLERTTKKVKEYYDGLMNRLKKQVNKQIQNYQKQYQCGLKQIKKLKMIDRQLERINETNKGISLEKFWRLVRQLQEQEESNELRRSFKVDLPIFKDTLRQLSPNFNIFTCDFKYNFNLLPSNRFQHDFYLNGQQWCLKVSTKDTQQGPQFLSVFLCLKSGYVTSNRYVYKIILLNLNDPLHTLQRQSSSGFKIGQSKGYPDFIKVSEIRNFASQGFMVFQIFIKNQTYPMLCEQMNTFINKLSSQKSILENLLRESNSQIQKIKASIQASITYQQINFSQRLSSSSQNNISSSNY